MQPQVGGQLPYGTGPLCSRVNLGTSDDLDFWLLLAAAEYGLGSRDTAFFDEPLPFRDSRQLATVWAHVKLAYQHQESSRGPHGGYLAGTNGDWSDFSSDYLHMTESMLVAAQVAYVYPRLAELADRLDDHAFAAQLRTRAAELHRSLAGAVDREGLVLARLLRRPADRRGRDLRRAAAVGHPGRRSPDAAVRRAGRRTSAASSTASGRRPRSTVRRGSARRSPRLTTTPT